MSSALPSTAAAQLPAEAETLSDAARTYAAASSAENTKRAYRAGWQDFTTWCEEHGRTPLPATAATVGNYLSALAPALKPATLALRLAAISKAHRLAGHHLDKTSPAIREVMQGKLGTAPDKKTAAVATIIRDVVDELARSPGLRAIRDRALLLIGYGAALRRSELVALDVADVTVMAEGLIVPIRRAKTDQQGAGATVAIRRGTSDRTCAVAALLAWKKAATLEDGPLFVSITRHGKTTGARLSDQAVALILKERLRAVKAADGSPTYSPKDFAGHSLRSGWITTVARAGALDRNIARHSRHRSMAVLHGYIQAADPFGADNVSGLAAL